MKFGILDVLQFTCCYDVNMYWFIIHWNALMFTKHIKTCFETLSCQLCDVSNFCREVIIRFFFVCLFELHNDLKCQIFCETGPFRKLFIQDFIGLLHVLVSCLGRSGQNSFFLLYISKVCKLLLSQVYRSLCCGWGRL